jgi:outer membrane protein OmpA-like peptidoglycan-associated protein
MNKRMIAALIGTSMAISGCKTMNPYTGEEEHSNALVYGAGAALVCGLIGATKNSKSARNAAAGCGLIGAGIGAYMDAQETELREELQGSGVQVKRDGDKIKLIMPGNITFDSNRYDLKTEFHQVLTSVSKVLFKYKDTKLVVSGHTDSSGKKQYNQMLSEKRADAVGAYLISQSIPANRVESHGYADDYPVASNDTADGKAQNRRVELDITAMSE